MVLNLEDVDKVGKATADRLRNAGIDSVEKLATIDIEELVKINGIGKSKAIKYKEYANKLLQMENNEITNETSLSKQENNPKKSTKKPENFEFVKDARTFLKKTDQEKEGDKIVVKTKDPKLEKPNPVKKKKKTKKKKKVDSGSKAEAGEVKEEPIQEDETEKEKPKEIKIGYVDSFFDREAVLRVRYLHHKILKLEANLNREGETITPEEIDYISEYVSLLNTNYKTKNHNLILKELNLTPAYHDPLDGKEYQIYDIMFECARAFWISALAYSRLSEESERIEVWDDAIIDMVESSRAFKAAALFSRAAIHQKEIGASLEPEKLEYKSEESRLLAQSIAAIKEDLKKNYFLASKLYAGLSVLQKRMFYLRKFDQKEKLQLQAQFHYDMGKSCQLKSKALQDAMIPGQTDRKLSENISRLQEKSNYYYGQAEEIWENILRKFGEMKIDEKNDIVRNLSVVNENIMQNDVEILPFAKVKNTQDPRPIIIVPENTSQFIPKSISYLEKYGSKDLNVKRLKRYKKKKTTETLLQTRKEKLLTKKSTLGRMINELRLLYENNDISVDKYFELLEKYTFQFRAIDKILERNSLSSPIKTERQEEHSVHTERIKPNNE